jgi:hypothetical protein
LVHAREVLGSISKDDHPLKPGDNPFIQYLHIGKYKEGYWSSAHMAVQFENVVDCCLALYGSTYDFLFLFDHSCGHDRKPTGALDAKALNVGYGGSQPTLNPSHIARHEGYLGVHHPRLLNPGDTQVFVFQEGDAGPHYLTEAQQQEKKFDRPTGRLLSKTKTKKELSSELIGMGVLDRHSVPNGLPELQQKAMLHNIDLKKNVEEIVEGWMGKAKGLSQIAWERGFLDPLQTYTKNELVDLLAKCTDFENAETNLQMIARTLGVQAEKSPKFHCEMAGEGIEYDWAYCKSQYRRRPLTEKKGAKNFKELVREVTSWEFVTKARSRRSSARARSYISGYYNIHFNNSSLVRLSKDELTTNGHDNRRGGGSGEVIVDEGAIAVAAAEGEAAGYGPWTPGLGEVLSMDIIEQAKKAYHSHRGVNSFEKGTHAC